CILILAHHILSHISLSVFLFLSFFLFLFFFFFTAPATTEIYTLSLHDALPIFESPHFNIKLHKKESAALKPYVVDLLEKAYKTRSEEHTSELQSRFDLVCRLLLEKKKKKKKKNIKTEKQKII